MKVEEKDGSVENKPRLMTRDLQPTYHECSLKLNYKLYAPEAAREYIKHFTLYIGLSAVLASSWEFVGVVKGSDCCLVISKTHTRKADQGRGVEA